MKLENVDHAITGRFANPDEHYERYDEKLDLWICECGARHKE